MRQRRCTETTTASVCELRPAGLARWQLSLTVVRDAAMDRRGERGADNADSNAKVGRPQSDDPLHHPTTTTNDCDECNDDALQPSSDCRLPVRFGIGVMGFVACSVSFMARANISIIILAMVRPPALANGTVVAMPDYGPRYAWTPAEQSALLGAFYYGSIVTVIPFGLLIDRYGRTRETIAVTFACGAALQALSPLVAEWLPVGALVAAGALQGAMQCTVLSSMHKLIANWAPPREVGRFVLYAQGTSVGTVAGWWLSGWTIEWWGWRSAYWVSAAVMFACMAAWLWVVYDRPAEHPRIAREEREFIERSLVGVAVGRSRAWPPMGRLLRSAPLWALVLLQFANLWGFFFVVTGVPKFLNEVFGLSIAQTGMLASLPYVTRVVAATGFAALADWLQRGERMSVMNMRRVFCVFSHIIPGCILFALPRIAGADGAYTSVGLLCAVCGFNGAVAQSVMANVHDIAPNFASTVLSLANGLSVASGFLSPVLIAWATAERSTIDEWRPVFAVNAAVFVVPALVFCVWGSGEVQPWNAHGQEKPTVDADCDAHAEEGDVELNALHAEKQISRL